VVAEPVLAAALKSPAVAETVFSATVLPAALKSLLTILAAVLLDVTAESEPRSVRAVCSERFSRASQAVMLLLVIRVAAPAEALAPAPVVDPHAYLNTNRGIIQASSTRVR
jgi:hypothetical protein